MRRFECLSGDVGLGQQRSSSRSSSTNTGAFAVVLEPTAAAGTMLRAPPSEPARFVTRFAAAALRPSLRKLLVFRNANVRLPHARVYLCSSIFSDDDDDDEVEEDVGPIDGRARWPSCPPAPQAQAQAHAQEETIDALDGSATVSLKRGSHRGLAKLLLPITLPAEAARWSGADARRFAWVPRVFEVDDPPPELAWPVRLLTSSLPAEPRPSSPYHASPSPNSIPADHEPEWTTHASILLEASWACVDAATPTLARTPSPVLVEWTPAWEIRALCEGSVIRATSLVHSACPFMDLHAKDGFFVVKEREEKTYAPSSVPRSALAPLDASVLALRMERVLATWASTTSTPTSATRPRIDALPLTEKRIPGVGRFTMQPNGSVTGVFDDRTVVWAAPSRGTFRALAPDGTFVGEASLSRAAAFSTHVAHVLEFAAWAAKTPSQRLADVERRRFAADMADAQLRAARAVVAVNVRMSSSTSMSLD